MADCFFFGQWRIQDFPEVGAPTFRGAPTYDLQNFPKNCMKLKEFGPRGGVLSRPPGSATVCSVYFLMEVWILSWFFFQKLQKRLLIIFTSTYLRSYWNFITFSYSVVYLINKLSMHFRVGVLTCFRTFCHQCDCSGTNKIQQNSR